MSATEKHKWEFKPRFRRGAFGWRSQPAVKRVKEAVSEIKRVARREPLLAAERAVCFLECIAPALHNVDSSSGSIGTSVNHAIKTLVPIIANSQAEESIRRKWLRRLWKTIQADQTPYLELLDEMVCKARARGTPQNSKALRTPGRSLFSPTHSPKRLQRLPKAAAQLNDSASLRSAQLYDSASLRSAQLYDSASLRSAQYFSVKTDTSAAQRGD